MTPMQASGSISLATKACCQCHQSKPSNEFLPSPRAADGLSDRCQQCVFGNAKQDRQKREERKAERETKRAAKEADTAKRCRTCKKSKPLDDFARHGQLSNGHRHHCKACIAAGRTRRRQDLTPEAKA